MYVSMWHVVHQNNYGELYKYFPLFSTSEKVWGRRARSTPLKKH